MESDLELQQNQWFVFKLKMTCIRARLSTGVIDANVLGSCCVAIQRIQQDRIRSEEIGAQEWKNLNKICSDRESSGIQSKFDAKNNSLIKNKRKIQPGIDCIYINNSKVVL